MRRFVLITVIMLGMFWLGCEENSTSVNDEDSNVNTFVSHNVKESGTQYFTFASQTSDTVDNGSWDIAFGVAPLTVEAGPCQYFTMSTDPIIFTGPGVTMVRVDAESLDELDDIPAAELFEADNPDGDPFIGKNWFDPTNGYAINPDVYVIKTCEDNFGLLDIKRFDMDFVNFRINNIVWDYKYNGDMSTDFITTTADSFATGDAYAETKYFSFVNGAVTAAEDWDIKVEGSTIWLGNGCSAKKLADTSLDAIEVISDEGFTQDVPPYYVSRDWYTLGENYLVTPDDIVFVIHTATGSYIALEIISYYDAEGNSGVFTVKWKYLEG